LPYLHDRVYGENEIVADEMFNNTAVYMGDWKAIKHEPPVGDGNWQLYNLTDNPTETINIADQHLTYCKSWSLVMIHMQKMLEL
jgi:arylsulfatase A-like enzyme